MKTFKFIMKDGSTLTIKSESYESAKKHIILDNVEGMYDLDKEVHSMDCGGSLIPLDEPTFVLRAQDETAPSIVLEWMSRNPQISEAKLKDAFDVALRMFRHPNRRKPD